MKERLSRHFQLLWQYIGAVIALYSFIALSAQAADKCSKYTVPLDQGGCKCNDKCDCTPADVTLAAKAAAAATAAASSCPSGWSPAVGTIYDSWPKPGTTECVDYEGCTWAGMFSTLDGGSSKPCKNGAQWLNGGNGKYNCRFPEATIRSWNMTATYNLDSALLGKKLQVMVQGRPNITVIVNVKDVCSDSDCSGCCRKNTGNKKWKLIDIEKWPASILLKFNPTPSNFDINNVQTPTSVGLRPGAPERSVMPLCYKVLGLADRLV